MGGVIENKVLQHWFSFYEDKHQHIILERKGHVLALMNDILLKDNSLS